MVWYHNLLHDVQSLQVTIKTLFSLERVVMHLSFLKAFVLELRKQPSTIGSNVAVVAMFVMVAREVAVVFVGENHS